MVKLDCVADQVEYNFFIKFPVCALSIWDANKFLDLDVQLFFNSLNLKLLH
jgi:hypothetical protein